MKRILAGAATLAMAISMAPSVHAQGNGNGNGKAKNNKPAAAQGAKGPKRNSPARNASADRGPAKNAGNVRSQPNRAASNANRAERGGPAARGNAGNSAANSNAPVRNAVRTQGPDFRSNDRRASDLRGNGNRSVQDTAVRGTSLFGLASRQGVIDGCPPGLAKKRNGCLPPGQAKKQAGYDGRYYRPDFFGLSSTGSGRYFYDDGYLLRLGSGGNVAGYIPLLGGALSIGNQWPNYYEPVRLPDYYSSYYGLGDPNSYRYANNAFYRIDPETQAITSIAALITGDEFVVGQPVPSGYGAYNVPYQYRDRYYDRPDAYYRYSDGYVYQVDPETRLVAAAIELLI